MNKEIEFTQELHQNFIDFSYEANSQRAFADARDGLKPGQRACLWEMYDKGYTSNKPHVKSAKISGGVIANWWPHGDVAIYDTFARMSQPWINNIPEVSWHGANGSQIISGEAAASRYTEARLSKAIEEGMLFNIKKHNVPMIKNFSEDAEWPEVLPAILPRLMINGCQGIGVTIANVWLPHNLKDLCDHIMVYLQEGRIETTNLYPDFPSGGIIINQKDIHTIYETGRGKVVLRAKTEIKNNNIIITEFPYQVYVEPWMESVKKLITDGTINNIENIYNRSNHKNGILVEVECTTNPTQVLNQLFKNTDLQKSYNANQFALVGKTPKLLNLKEYFDIYINHNLDCIVKECNFDLTKAEARLEIVNGLLKALEDIDNIIALIKASESAAAAKINLITKYNFTENQAKAILAMRLSSLAKLEKVELNKEAEDLNDKIFMFHQILDNRDEQIGILKVRLQGLVNKYGDARRTELAQIEITKEEKEKAEIIPEDVVVIINNLNEVKRIPKKSFKVQHRRGVGVKTASESPKMMLATNTINTLMIFTSEGKMYRLNVDKIPEGTNTSRGVNLKTILKLDDKEIIQEIASARGEKPADYVVFFTKNGLVKKTKFEEYVNTKKTTGIQAIKIKDNDELAFVRFMNDDEKIILVTEEGYAIKFTFNDIKPIGRLTSGVKGINLRDGDGITGAINFSSNDDYVVLITKEGKSKRMPISDFTIQNRGGRGVIALKLDPNDYVAAALRATEKDLVLIAGKPNSICVPVNEISIQSKLGGGTKIIERSVVESATIIK